MLRKLRLEMILKKIIKLGFLWLVIGACNELYAIPFIQDSLLIIAKVEVYGNKKTNTDIVLRELTFKVGDRFKPEHLHLHLERSRQNIFNTNLFLTVDADYLQEDSLLTIQYTVREKMYIVGLPILYLADRSFNEWWYDRGRDLSRLIYGLQLNHNNLSGNNDKLRLRTYWGFIPYFELSYTRPYIDKRQRMGLRGGLYYSLQKSIPFRTWNDKLDFLASENKNLEREGLFLEYKLRNALYHFHTIYIGANRQSVADSIGILNPDFQFGISNSRKMNYLTLSYDYLYDKRDNVQYPLKGNVFMLGLTHYTSIRRAGNQTNLEARWYNFFPLFGKTYFDYNLRLKFSHPQRQVYSFVRGFGYNGTLVRGYQLNVIDGQHYGLLQTNLKQELIDRKIDVNKIWARLHMGKVPIRIFAHGFYDLGYVKNYFPELSNTKLGNRLLSGYGLGLDFVSFYDTSLNINYSRNEMGFGKFYIEARRGL